MKFPVSTQLKDRIAKFVAVGPDPQLSQTDTAFEQIAPDVGYFRAQAEALLQSSIKPYVAVMYDEDDTARTHGLDVPIQAEDLANIEASYSRMFNVLERSSVELKRLDDVESLEVAFVDRLAESVATMYAHAYMQINGPMVFGQDETIVNSNRTNDTILYAKGYFLSTGTAFGISTPAKAYLLPSRYSFGIVESAGPRFENVLWSCPTTVHLRLP